MLMYCLMFFSSNRMTLFPKKSSLLTIVRFQGIIDGLYITLSVYVPINV